MSSGKKFCALTEINLGVPVPYFSDLVLRQLVGDRQATEIMYTGALILAEKALRVDFVDALFETDKVTVCYINRTDHLPAHLVT